jgi:AcrR family transcriptional regulator
MVDMGRWQPDALGRLERAAFELYAQRGYEQTTVTEIAERAGVTERTFFRYFADKREVLFSGSSHLVDIAVEAVSEAPASMAPIDAVGAALEAGARVLQLDREHATRRQLLIDANPSLQERELLKMTTLSTAIAGALRDRGVGSAYAEIAAAAGSALFAISFRRWISPGESRDYPQIVRDSLLELKTVAAGRS